jgi:UDP-N-acetyl-D-galactosamine dehydrogenase
MTKGAIVVFVSTVYPGATEEVCVPALEAASGLSWPQDFNVGYSPERINPGDKAHTLQTIVKVVAGDNPETLALLAELYGSVVDAGIHQASSIKVAEAAKVIENTQRDLNIDFVNELSLVFDRLGIDTNEVLDAACTKWNFLNFRPGLVGGHCIGVDPYYLTAKAQEVGYSPEVILAGRRINDSMGSHIANETVKVLMSSKVDASCKDIIVCGLTFKENCPDLRNSLVINIISDLKDFGYNVHVCDPVPSAEEALLEYGVKLVDWSDLPQSAAIVCAVNHEEFAVKTELEFSEKIIKGGLFVDVKSIKDKAEIQALDLQYWSL